MTSENQTIYASPVDLGQSQTVWLQQNNPCLNVISDNHSTQEGCLVDMRWQQMFFSGKHDTQSPTHP